jgi:putative sterol carrier protein
VAVFPSKEWCQQAIELANADPESRAAGEGWVGDFGLVVEREPGKLPEAFAIHCLPRDGQITAFRVLGDPDELEEIEPCYLASAPYSVWKGLIRGTVDPIQAVAQRKLRFFGDLEQLVQRVKYKGIVDRVLARLRTEFPDERR